MNPWHMEPVPPKVNHDRGLRAKRTVCPKGHLITGENEVLRTGGARCRICSNAYQRAYRRSVGHKHQNAYKARKKESKNRLW